jgi:transcriptional regulator with XRE-family HTH domain
MKKNRLEKLRKGKEFTIKKVAERMEVQPITIKRWEEGIKLPQLQKLATLSDMYDSSISYALGLTDIKRNNENQEVDPRLQEIRESYRMARHELAKELGVSSINSVYNWETGKAQMKLDVAIKIANLFGVSLDYLLGLTHYKRWELMSRQEKGASELDKNAHRIYDFATGKSEGWYETDVICLHCGRKLETSYCEERAYIVRCKHCKTVTITKGDSPKKAAEKIGIIALPASYADGGCQS